jgi:tRNA A37 threonylcarbamoyladenosine dehydratase
MRFDRCKKLFSKFHKLQKLNILIAGVGGVGGYALDCLTKSGVKNITIVDYDTFDITNQQTNWKRICWN